MNPAIVALGRSAFSGASTLVLELAYATAARMVSDDELAAIFPGITLTEHSLDYAQTVESTDCDEEATDGLLNQLFNAHGEDVIEETGNRLEEFTNGMVAMLGLQEIEMIH